MSTSPVAADRHLTHDSLLLRFDALEAKLRKARPHDDLRLLREAFEYASCRHESQTRASGEPYIAHPLEVAHILADRRLDRVCLITSLLHDVVEDTAAGLEEIERRFGPEVAGCVDGVTKLSLLDYNSTQAQQAENYRKMLLAMVRDIRVILVKLADRLHNMRTLEYLSEEKQRRIARETWEIYAPIALRLGMGRIWDELRDLAIAYLEPEAYREITAYIESRREADDNFLHQVKEIISKLLDEAGVPATVEGRIKRPSSVYEKTRRGVPLPQMYDLLALRVITDTEKNCYAALGLINNRWTPVTGTINDYISRPRPNLYQSLHTSLITDKGQKFEVQIRTWDMHRMAEEGICSHWKYKEGRIGADADDQRMAWLRQLVEWQQDMPDPTDFMSTLKVDLYPEEVYVFTPKGKLLVLPQGATPVDFAYLIHTEVGHTCVGAKVNGRIVPLKYSLSNGDSVEIITQAGHPPSRDWLSFVRTSRARNKIKHWLNTHRRKRAEEIGFKLLDKEAKRMRISLKKIDDAIWERVCRDYGFSKPADLYAALGYGRYSAKQILSKFLPEDDRQSAHTAPTQPKPAVSRRPGASPGESLIVSGIDDMLVYRAGCCNPIRGEPIVGYVTRGKGVAVHATSCANVENLMYDAERRIDVQWANAEAEELNYEAKLEIRVDDRPGLLKEITSILSDEGINISQLSSRAPTRGGPALIDTTISVRDLAQLTRVIASIQRVPHVSAVRRS